MRSFDCSESCIIIQHIDRSVIEERWRAAQEWAGKRASLKFSPLRCRLSRTPLPSVAAHIVDAVGADAAGVAVDWGGAADAVFAAVALGWGTLAAPRVDVA